MTADKISASSKLLSRKNISVLLSSYSATSRLKFFRSVRLQPFPAVVWSPAVQSGSPASEQEVDRRGADNWCVGDRERCRVEKKRSSLGTAEPPVEGDQLLERAAFFQSVVVETPDHDVGDVGKAVCAQQMLGSVPRERCQWIDSVDAARGEVVRSRRAENDGPFFCASDQEPADVRVTPQRRQEARMSVVQFFERESAPFVHEINESQVSGAEDDHVTIRDIVFRLFLRLLSGRLSDRVADHRALLVPACDLGHAAVLE